MTIRTKDEIKIRLYDLGLDFKELQDEATRLNKEKLELEAQLNEIEQNTDG